MRALHKNLSLDDALRAARELGCAVMPVRGTGEVRVTHPIHIRSLRINARRKDTTQHLIAFLRKIPVPGGA